ncbi:hypothetical protein SMACR_00750 [Sordaria macrospora]|uniref:DUF221 domain-containing protein n=1 Tax=Sordaria macrospora TaxID=5147 RepID=A0A8S8ZVC6_SORMA|nr:hypothetical protein SMACR_00750 [Sordaria macrospora]KAH7631158.1 hypothetical protein B0T09DRAFT_131113 [Sordaria sp. MPI-SDFR-AT-0083]WPJ61746.1 hypothetical protein SMAC4_00750 [Sordaria macrospora]
MSDIPRNTSDTDEAQTPVSLSGMISTLVPVLVTSAIYIVIFLILRKSNRRYYAPRTYLGSLRENERSPSLSSGLFSWFKDFWKIPDVYALQHQSLDSYLFIRYLRMAVTICFVGCCITWPVLFPVNATGGGDQKELDILTYGNIDRDTQYNRYYAHVFISWIFLGFVMYLIMRECMFYINLRQAFLISPLYSQRISSRTVLFTSVPEPYLDEHKLRKIFGASVKNVWITSETKEVDELVKERDKVALRLEKAEVKLIKLANKIRRKAMVKGAVDDIDKQAPLDAESGSIAARWVPRKKRPTHRLGPLGLIGKKVDTIDWCREELMRLIPEAEAAQDKYRDGAFKKVPGVFIEFRTQADAEGAAQILAHHQGLHMTPKYIGIRPSEIVWKSLAISWWQRVIRRYAVYAFITAMIVFWAIPVGVVGIISNVNFLKTISFLTWLDKIPDVIMGVVTGLLPSVALSILMSLVPVVIRICAKQAGEPSLSRVELFTQNAYFAFQVIQVFLVATVASSATAVAKKIYDNPGSVPSLLSENLPKSSNFYISYFIVQGLSIATSVLTQVVGFFVFNLLYKFLASTPRALYTKWANLSAISWGSTLPVYTNIVVIAIAYSTIAPLMLGWAALAMGLFYLAWRYNVLFVTDTQIDTRGLIYPRAMKQLFTGVYLAEICMIGLFGASVAPGPLVLMIIFLVFTVLFHISMNSALNPLMFNLPLNLLAEEEGPLLDTPVNSHATENGHGAPTNGNSPTTGPNYTEKIPSNGTNGAQSRASDPILGAKEALDAERHEPNYMTGKKPNFLTKFLKPWIYSDYRTLRAFLPRGVHFDPYAAEVERDAYCPPSVTSDVPLLWIPSDANGAGVSRQEVEHTSRAIPITDEGCELDEKGHLVWDQEGTRPPIWEEKIYY